ncbi:glycosyltransferase [Zhouia sp. CL16]|nr:glycosyltransferase [Zhouia amylolytica]
MEKSNCNNLLFFGRIEPYKGIENLYQLGEKLLGHNLNYKIIIAGKGEVPKISNLPSNITIINNFIPEEELRDLHESALFTVLPYNSATQSGVIIQSFAYGTPVIAYDVGALGEYVDHLKTGILVKHNDFDAIIDFLVNLDQSAYLNMQDNVRFKFNHKYCDRSFASYSKSLYKSWGISCID